MNLRRAYFECRYGQIHVRTAFPSTGGFDERTPLICLHELGRSSGTFEGLLPHIATDRSVYACDLPGFGASDSSAGALGVSDHAAAVADFLGGLRLRTVDVLGVGLGAAVALELAILLDSKIRKLVLVHAPFSSRDLSPVSPVPPAANGSYLIDLWTQIRGRRGASEPIEALAGALPDELRSLAATAEGIEALRCWPGIERLKMLKQPSLLLQSEGGAADAVAAVLAPNMTLDRHLPPGDGLSAVSPETLGALLRSFLDR